MLVILRLRWICGHHWNEIYKVFSASAVLLAH
jgi:hypothetical protein